MANTLDVGVTYNGQRSTTNERATNLWGYSSAITTDSTTGQDISTAAKLKEAAEMNLLETTEELTCMGRPNLKWSPVSFAIFQHRESTKTKKKNPQKPIEVPKREKEEQHVREMKKVFNQSGTYIVGSSDASLADNPDTRRSSCGYAWFLNGAFVVSKATQQTVIALSSCESEYIASCMAIKISIYLRGLLSELGFPQTTTLLYTDNSANIDLSMHSRISPRTAHIDTRYHFVKAQVQNKSIELRYIKTEQMPSDTLTKSLDKTRHLRHASILQNELVEPYIAVSQ